MSGFHHHIRHTANVVPRQTASADIAVSAVLSAELTIEMKAFLVVEADVVATLSNGSGGVKKHSMFFVMS